MGTTWSATLATAALLAGVGVGAVGCTPAPLVEDTAGGPGAGRSPVPSAAADGPDSPPLPSDPAVDPGPNPEPEPGPEPLPLGVPYRDPDGRFLLVPPPDWGVAEVGLRETAEGVAVLFRSPPAADAQPAALNVVVRSAPADLGGVVTGVRGELRAVPGYRFTTDEAVRLRGGTPAHLVAGHFPAPDGGAPLRMVQLFAVTDGRLVLVTGTAPEPMWPAVGDPLDAAVRSLAVPR